MHVDYPLPPSYTIFGRVTEGQDIVDAIATSKTDPGDSTVVRSKDGEGFGERVNLGVHYLVAQYFEILMTRKAIHEPTRNVFPRPLRVISWIRSCSGEKTRKSI